MGLFDKDAINYDQWYDSKLGSFVDKVETELALSLFKPKSGMKILDLGCGTGNFSIKLAEMGCKVIGIDISEEMLNQARKKIKGKDLDIEFHVMDAHNLNFSDDTFDGVFSMAAFEFIKKPQKVYDEMYRVLKKNGSLLIGTINKEGKWGEFYTSSGLQADSVFKYADFKSMEELKSWNPKDVVDSGECLFIPPDTKEEDISMDLENKLSTKEVGGYICVLWIKKT